MYCNELESYLLSFPSVAGDPDVLSVSELPALALCVCVGGGGRVIAKLAIDYSETSNSGPSKKGTQYIRPLYKGHCLRSQKNYLPYSFNTLTTSKKRTTSLQRTKLVNLHCPQCAPCLEVPLYYEGELVSDIPLI